MYRSLVLFATALTFCLVVIGAFVRLSGAGLGCPDWPGCYGQITPHHAQQEIAEAVQAQGGAGPVSLPKAWKEMGHRYVAGTLGLLLLLIAIIAWRKRASLRQSPALPTAIVLITMLQAALGMWTVTLLLKPVIVTLHLLGGLTILALMTWLSLRQLHLRPAEPVERIARLRPALTLGLILMIAQIMLGGWVSSNYAALACTDLPLCRGQWFPPMDFSNAFHIIRALGKTAEGDPLTGQALTAIHWMHRVGALVVALYSTYLALRVARFQRLRPLAGLLVFAVLLQFTLGVLNVFLSLPLPIAVAHNAGAAFLLVIYVVLNYTSYFAANSRFRFA